MLLLVACIPTSSTYTGSTNDVSDIYNPGSTSIHPKYELFHENDSVSILYVYLYTPELGYITSGANSQARAKIKINYKVMASFQNKAIIDTATKIINIKKEKDRLSFVTKINLKSNHLENYILQVFIKDINKNRSNLEFIYVDKTDKNSSQNFLLKYPNNSNPIFNDYIASKQKCNIEYRKPVDNLYITRFDLDSSLSSPPFSSLKNEHRFKKDTAISIKYENSINFDYSKQGVYFIQTDRESKHGKTIINLGDDYPLVQTSSKMLEPLQYLTTSEEFKHMLKQPNKKIVVDNFWLNTTDNINMAKEMIRIFYSRVFYSNILFTSYKEGWKTDRGMIYIILGPPRYLYIGDNYEKWVYDDNDANFFHINFKKKKHKFTENNFILERGVKYKDYWTEAVAYWREGKIY